MELGFKFGIGDVVRLAISANQSESKAKWSGEDVHNELRGQVVSRLLEECPGGIQRHYQIRWVRHEGGITRDIMRHNEVELVASEQFAKNKTTEEVLQDVIKDKCVRD